MTDSGNSYDVVVVGGGTAGLSGAVALARFRRSVLVFDAGEPRNAAARHVHNMLTRDGTPPAELLAAGRAEVLRYGGQVESAAVTALATDGPGFLVRTAARAVRARKLLVTTGSADELPDVPGLHARWGLDVLHCPYCHGWEVRDQRIGILATSELAMHQTLLFRQLSASVTLLRHTDLELTAEQLIQLAALGIPVVDGPVVAVETGPERLEAVRLADGTRIPLDAVVVAPVGRARADLLAPLGLQPSEVRVGEVLLGTVLPAEPDGRTTTPGVFAAGNLVDLRAQVISSAAAGLLVAGTLNAELITEDVAAATATWTARSHHDHGTAPEEDFFSQQAWEDRYRSSERTWSGAPNAALVDEVAALDPGTALDAGAGEGGDACWLAEQGWQVTAADFSTVALDRIAAEAERRGLRLETLHLDVTREAPAETYDLVSAFYLHLPREPRVAAVERLARAVRPGGTLLIVAHDFSDAGKLPRPHLADAGWTVAEVVEQLASTFGPEAWEIVTDEVRPRTTTTPDGQQVDIADTVMRARRR